MNDKSVFISNKNFIIIDRMLNNRLYGTGMDNTSTAMFSNPKQKKVSFNPSGKIGVSYVFSMISVGIIGFVFNEKFSILNE